MAVIKKFRIKSFKKQKPIVSLKKISLSFGKRQILDNINFEVNQGQILGLLGPNGVGKSTIFNLITGLIKPAYGSIIFNGIDATNYPIYERTDNAYKNATHMFFNIGVPGVSRTGWESMGDTFKGTKLREGVQSASDHQNFVTLELVSIHN